MQEIINSKIRVFNNKISKIFAEENLHETIRGA